MYSANAQYHATHTYTCTSTWTSIIHAQGHMRRLSYSLHQHTHAMMNGVYKQPCMCLICVSITTIIVFTHLQDVDRKSVRLQRRPVNMHSLFP